MKSAESYTGDAFEQDYQSLEAEEEELIQNLSGFYSGEGIAFLDKYHETDLKVNAQKAYACFQKSEKYLPLTVELDSMMDNCLEVGKLIYNIDVSTGWNISHAWKIDQIMNGLANKGGTFLKVYYNGTIATEDLDCDIDIDFSSLDIDTKEEEDSKTYEEEIITTETTTNDDGEEIEVEVVTVVTATVFTKETIKTAEWDVDVSVGSSKNCGAQQTRFSEKVTSKIETERFEGDERALPSSFKPDNNETLKSDSDMIDELLNLIYSSVESVLF